MNAEDSSSPPAADVDVSPSKGGTSTSTDEEMAEPHHQSTSADADASKYNDAEQAASAAAKKHTVTTEVPKFRFVAIAKKSAGYSSAASGSYIEGKSAEELAAQYQAPDVVASDTSMKKKEPVVVGKLNIAERQSKMEEEFGLGSGFDKRVNVVEEKEEEEEEEEPTTQEQVVESTVEQQTSEEKDLEAAIPAATETKKVVNEVVSNDEKMQRQGVFYSVNSEVVGIVIPANKEDTSKENTAERRKCSIKNLILLAILVILLVAAIVLGIALSRKPSSGDDASSSLQGENENNNVADGNATSVLPTDGTSENLASVSCCLLLTLLMCVKHFEHTVLT
jgi:hypothetical protein